MFNPLHHHEQEYLQHIPERFQPPPSPVRNPEPSATTNNHPVVIPVATPPMSIPDRTFHHRLRKINELNTHFHALGWSHPPVPKLMG